MSLVKDTHTIKVCDICSQRVGRPHLMTCPRYDVFEAESLNVLNSLEIWKCPACDSHNSDRATCYFCNRPKPQDTFGDIPFNPVQDPFQSEVQQRHYSDCPSLGERTGNMLPECTCRERRDNLPAAEFWKLV